VVYWVRRDREGDFMKKALKRTAMIFGEESLEKLKKATVLIVGIGGVGAYVAEGLVRSGVGKLILCDYDRISETNINRQLHATYLTIGQLKVQVMKERLLTINPELEVITYAKQYTLTTQSEIMGTAIDYVVDAIDQVTGKIQLALYCQERKIPIIAAMGTGNKVEPTALEVADIYETSVCPLARVMRKELKKRGVEALQVVYSKEIPRKSKLQEALEMDGRRSTPGSVAFVPSVAGFIIVSEVVKALLAEGKENE